ncbi:DUF2892 domain-containing protein [Helicobacter sp. MIT 14-3879]|uniref:YgaP family membrane protein n=1 Tax=Helicobacter sp. MIT 14-3879 TaxID=2040649 RepID=UPI000E1F78B6|nr:DUF2892 domain-containing protein [Helicobacter sp. MIT 14-3879]RDU63485.1 DUF2892 domain-containing protein [Helicobacter sp. MIT 14-3879]
MKKNIGKIDKIIRIILGLAFISYGVIFANFIWIFGILFLISVYLSFCPFYKLLKIQTNRNDRIDSNSCDCGCGK